MFTLSFYKYFIIFLTITFPHAVPGSQKIKAKKSLRDILSDFENGGLVSHLDAISHLLFSTRTIVFNRYNFKEALSVNTQNGKIQKKVPLSTPFPCPLNGTRSPVPPSNVNELRPGDIDIICAIGDSSSAGTSVIATNIMHVAYESRGVVFTGGGRANWRRFLTLPNIFKVFNPNLYGYSIADSTAMDRNSRLNVAEPGIMSRDLIFQAKVLVNRMVKDPHVDMQRHWKLLTIFVNNVDFCGDYCTHSDVAVPLRRHEKDLHTTLAYLRDNVPRLLVNLLPAPNGVQIFPKMKRLPLTCAVMHRVFCNCVMNATYNKERRIEYSKKIQLWQDLDAHIAKLPEFNTEDFAVVYQPITANAGPRILRSGEVDLRFFANDCFHFSQLGHATLANAVWNNLLQPVGHKQLYSEYLFKLFECPTEERPYIATMKNSF